MWIAIGVSIAVQIVGWIPTLDLLSGGGLNAIDGLVSANVLIKAGLLGSVPLVLAIIEKVRKKTPTKGAITLSVVLITISLYCSGISAILGTAMVGDELYGFLCMPVCIAASILYIVFGVRAIKAIKNTALQNQYPCPPQYQNQDVSDEICVTTNGGQDQ